MPHLQHDLGQAGDARARERSLPMLLVTHDEAEARAMATHAWTLQGGRLQPRW